MMQNPQVPLRALYFKRLCLWLLLVTAVASGAKLFEMDDLVRQKFEGKRWRLPSAIFARPLELAIGTPLRESQLERELKELSYSPVRRLQQPGEYLVDGGVFTIYRRSFMFPDANEDAAKILVQITADKVSRIELNGKAALRTRLDPLKIGGIYPTQKEDRKLVRLSQVPTYLVNAIVAMEDKGFYGHMGVSPQGLGRAMLSNLKAGHFVQGGSTITQQLVKNFYLTNERSLKRKAIEAIYAVLLELHYDKEEILETYINEVYLGQNGDNAIHGFGLASEYYFGRPIETISLDQAALLAAIVNGPSYYNPVRYPERCEKRRNLVMKTLLKEKMISKKVYVAAIAKKLRVNPSLASATRRFPAYLDLVRRNLQRDFGAWDLAQEGLRIFTALDPQIQWQSEAATAEFMTSQGPNAAKLQVAAIVVSEQGEVQSIVGDKVPNFQGFNRALDARRSIGSLAKPAVLLAALSDSAHYSLSSQVADAPIRVPVGASEFWQPKNFDGYNHGMVSLQTMLSRSYNQATVRLGMQLGLARVQETFSKLTGKEEIPEGPSIMLGSMNMSPFEVAGMYNTFFNRGLRRDLTAVRGVQTREGNLLKSLPSSTLQVFDSRAVRQVQTAMQAVIDEGTGSSVYDYMPRSLRAAGKTGTTNDQRDSWFAGFTGDKLAVAWVGNDQNEPTNLTGSSGGLAVWAKIMASVSRKSLDLNAPLASTSHLAEQSSKQSLAARPF